MLYLLDANTLINAKNFYYPFNRVPEFWGWLVHQGQLSNIKIPIEIYEEFKDTKPKDGEKDDLAQWAERLEVKKALLFDEEAEPNLVTQTTEVSKPKRLGANRHVPDVCAHFSIRCINNFQLIQELDFSTSWKKYSFHHPV